MRIAVCMKPVVDTGKAGDLYGRIDRSNDNAAENPADILALETAVYLKRKRGAEIDLFTMGPAWAEKLLRTGAKFGADKLFLISDMLFSGSDTYITAKVLTMAIKREPTYDLILCGQQAIDGETGQVPGELSAMLDIPWISNVTFMESVAGNSITCRSTMDENQYVIQASMPAVLSISCGMEGIGHPILPFLTDLRQAASKTVAVLCSADLKATPCEVGLHASPTTVLSVAYPNWRRTCRKTTDIQEGAKKTRRVIYGG